MSVKVGDDISIGLTMDSREFTVQVKNADVLLKELRKSLTDTATSTKRVEEHLTGVGTAFRHFMIMAATARFALLDFHDVFLRLPLSIVKTSGEIERMTKLMEGLSTATDKVADAKKGRNFVFDMAQNAPFDVKALTDSFVKLKSGGIDPMNGSMKALVDSIARFGGNSEQLHRASIAIQQMAGKGVVSMEELRQQLGEAVPTAINMMATGVGKSMSDLVKSISNGEVEAKSALERMFAVMQFENEGAASKMMDTWEGMLAKLNTKWSLFKYELAGGDSGQGAFADAKKAIEDLLASFDSNTARKFGTDLSEVVGGFAVAFKDAIQFVIRFYDEVKIAGATLIAAFAASKLVATFATLKAEFSTLSLVYAKSAAEYTATSNAKLAVKANENIKMTAMMTAEIAMIEKNLAAQTALYGMTGGALYKQNIAALQARLAVVEANVVAERALITQMNAAGAAAVATGGKLAGLMGVFNALGGPIMIVTGIIMGAIYIWDKYANAAERAANRAKNAWMGVADAKELAETREEKADLKGQIEKDEKHLEKGFNRTEITRRMDSNKKRLAEIEELERRQEYNIKKQGIDDAVAQENALLDMKNTGNANAWQRAFENEKKERDAQNKQRLSKLKEGSKEYSEEVKRQATEESEATKKYAVANRDSKLLEIDSRLTAVTAEFDAAGRLGDAGKEKADQALAKIKALNEARETLLQGINPEKIGTPYVSVKSKDDKGGGSSRVPVVGSLEKHLNDAKAELTIAEAKLQQVSGQISKVDLIETEVREKYEKMLANGELTKTYKDKKGNTKKQGIDARGKDKELYEELIATETRAKQVDAALGATKTSAKALASETEMLDEKIHSSGFGAEFANKKMMALSAEYEKQKALLGGVVTGQLSLINAQRMLVAAREANIEYHNATIDESAKLEIDLIDNSQEKIRKQYELTTRKLEEEYRRRRDDFIVSAETTMMDEKEEQEKLLALAVDFEERKANALKKFQKDSETPLERLGKQWQDVTENMQQATANWANGFMDQLTELITTGKADWRKFTVSILTDIARISAQKAIGGAVSSVIGAAGSLLGGLLGGGGGGGSGGFLGNGITLKALGGAFVSSGELSKFANGGAFTNGVYADPTLFKFANGGKFGVMGEAGPEAVMPLARDANGRLGVNVVGGGSGDAPNVSIVIQVNQNDGTEKSSSSGEDAQVWKKLADRIKGVVKEEMVIQQRPGGLLYK